MVKADTPTVTVTKGNEQYSAPWVVESLGGTVKTSSAATAGGITTVQTASAAAKTLPTTPTRQNVNFRTGQGLGLALISP